jgi:hypothetical protein
MHDNVEVCGEVPKVTLVGVKVHDRPAGVDAETERFTVPVNPFSEVTVIVDVPEEPTNIWDGVTTLAAMLKSAPPALTATVTVRVSVPLVPVIVTLKLIAVVHPAVRVAVFGVGRVTEAGEIVAVHPLGTTEVTDRAMLPVNPFWAFAAIVDVPVLGAV